MEDAGMIEISYAEFIRLLKRSQKLYALEACGVDNWEGYSEATIMYHNLLEEMEENGP